VEKTQVADVALSTPASELRKIKVEWEADGLKAPGVFQEYTNKPWSEELVNELVAVEKVVPLDAAGAIARNTETVDTTPASMTGGTNEAAADEDSSTPVSNDFPAITFYPDGSSDSAEIVLASVNDEDTRRMAVRVSGILGAITKHPVEVKSGSDSSLEDFEEETSVPAGGPAPAPLRLAATAGH
jgi:hypothetical protein